MLTDVSLMYRESSVVIRSSLSIVRSLRAESIRSPHHSKPSQARLRTKYRVSRYVRGASDDASPNDALRDFKRFPTWMWRNTDVLDFVGWLKGHNDAIGNQTMDGVS